MGEIIQKECAACGAYFKTDKVNVKYCPECRAGGNPTKLKYKADRAIGRSIREYGTGRKPQPRIVVCGNCGKEFSTWNRHAGEYCSEECRKEAAAKIRKCARCGKLLYPLGIICEKEPGFCSEECKTIYGREMNARYRAALRKQGYVHECPNCGKVFIRQKTDAIFCSKGCRANAARYGWKKEPEPRWEPCQNCGKTVWTMPAKYVFCSGECSRAMRPKLEEAERKRESVREERKRLHAERRAAGNDPEAMRKLQERQKTEKEQQKEQQKLQKKSAKMEHKGKEKKDAETKNAAYLAQNGLCSVCKTPYCDCERMQSEFRVIPQGARYGMNGKIAECPKFRG